MRCKYRKKAPVIVHHIHGGGRYGNKTFITVDIKIMGVLIGDFELQYVPTFMVGMEHRSMLNELKMKCYPRPFIGNIIKEKLFNQGITTL